MKTHLRILVLSVVGLLVSGSAHAQVPRMIHYQGKVTTMAGSPFHGLGQFKFALVDNGGTMTYWSNDGSSAAGAAPTLAVTVPVNKGIYSVLLGNTTLAGMLFSIPPSIFTNTFVYLRIWFSDGAGPFTLMSPDIRIVSAGYAMIAESVVNGSIDAFKLADGAVTTAKLADNAVTSTAIANASITDDKIAAHAVNGAKLAYDNELGNPANAGTLSIWAGDAAGGTAFPGLTLSGADRTLTIQDSDGDQAVQMGTRTSGGGQVELAQRDGTIGAALLGDRLGANSGGALQLYNKDGGMARLTLMGDSGGAGYAEIRNANGANAVTVHGRSNEAGGMDLYQADGSTVGMELRGDAAGGNTGGRIQLYQGDGDVGVYLNAEQAGAGYISIRDATGTSTIRLYGEESSGQGSQMLLYNGSHDRTIQIDADDDDAGGWIGLYTKEGWKTIELDANAAGGARITTQVLEITGGSDLSESFDIHSLSSADAPKPGMIVCIDSDRPGGLVVSHQAYDRTVVGVLSGAGGVQPGLLMGQHGTMADGQHPVALTGRVYCCADATRDPIRPGDLLTTSERAGHAMKATDPSRAQGAIVGKAMTSLTEGTGLVLVLVSLQ